MDELKRILNGAAYGARRRLEPGDLVLLPFDRDYPVTRSRESQSDTGICPLEKVIECESLEQKQKLICGFLDELAGDRSEYRRLLTNRLEMGHSIISAARSLGIEYATARSVTNRAERKLGLKAGWRKQ